MSYDTRNARVTVAIWDGEQLLEVTRYGNTTDPGEPLVRALGKASEAFAWHSLDHIGEAAWTAYQSYRGGAAR